MNIPRVLHSLVRLGCLSIYFLDAILELEFGNIQRVHPYKMSCKKVLEELEQQGLSSSVAQW
jgi:hypothetical protein